MSNFRFISYLYEYKKEQKGRNTGFVRVRGFHDFIELNMQVKPAKGTYEVYVHYETLPEVKSILVGTIRAVNGECHGVFHNILPILRKEGLSFSAVEALTVWQDKQICHGTGWTESKCLERLIREQREKEGRKQQQEETESEEANVKEVQIKERNLSEIRIEEKKSEEKETGEAKIDEREIEEKGIDERVIGGREDEEKVIDERTIGEREREDKVIDERTIGERERKEKVIDERTIGEREREEKQRNEISIAELKEEGTQQKDIDRIIENIVREQREEKDEEIERNDGTELEEKEMGKEEGKRTEREESEEEEQNRQKGWPKPKNIEELMLQLEGIPSFGNDSFLKCVKIMPKDIGLLNTEDWYLGKNSFLLHGYFAYQYLMLGFIKFPDGGKQAVLGVPGVYNSKDKYLAELFGFTNFIQVKKEEIKTGTFGYWITYIHEHI